MHDYKHMIQLSRFNGTKFYLNAEMIISVESTPDTVITLSNDKKMLVRESASEVVKRIIQYRRIVNNPQLDVQIGE